MKFEDSRNDSTDNVQKNKEENEEDEEDQAPPDNISLALCSMLNATQFGQAMRLPPNCPPNFFMNPALVASQLQSSYMQHMASMLPALNAVVCAKQNEQ